MKRMEGREEGLDERKEDHLLTLYASLFLYSIELWVEFPRFYISSRDKSPLEQEYLKYTRGGKLEEE